MPEEDFSAVHSPGLSVSTEISHRSPQSFRLVLAVAPGGFIRRHSKLKRTLLRAPIYIRTPLMTVCRRKNVLTGPNGRRTLQSKASTKAGCFKVGGQSDNFRTLGVRGSFRVKKAMTVIRRWNVATGSLTTRNRNNQMCFIH